MNRQPDHAPTRTTEPVARGVGVADVAWLEVALAMGLRGLGTTAPNPSVGAVLVRDGELIGRGWTQPGGRPHAEAHAIAAANAYGENNTTGAALYVTLEPCSHEGRSGACVEKIIAAGIARVVCIAGDPNPEISGDGFVRLREAGIRVDRVTDMDLRRAAGWQLAGHILAQTRGGRGLTQAKIAVDAEGRYAAGNKKPVWVTGAIARSHGHLMRARADAIVVGAGTARSDDPSLDCRIPGLEFRSPRRVVVAGSRIDQLPPEARLFRDLGSAPTTLIGTQSPADPPDGVTVLRLPASSHGNTRFVAPGAIAPALFHAYGATRILIEGGPALIADFLRHDLIDELLVYRAPHALGAEGKLLPAPLGDCIAPGGATGWTLVSTRILGPDRLDVFRLDATDTALLDATEMR